MSPPPPLMVQPVPVPLVGVWLPAGVAPPTSWQVQAERQTPAGGCGVLLSTTWAKPRVRGAAVLYDGLAMPASTAPVRLLSACVDPGTAVQVVPSGDVYAVK